jgi:hypothetical protein
MSLVKLGKPSGKKGFKNSVAVIQRMKELAVKETRFHDKKIVSGLFMNLIPL